MLDLLFSLLLGILLGILAGLIPGLHPNTFSLLLITLFFKIFSPLQLFVVIVSSFITNSFVSFIPSILFGAPEEGESLSVLPGHKLLLKGRGYEAIYFATLGGGLLLFPTLFFLPFIIFLMPKVYAIIKFLLPFILSFILIFLILSEKNKGKAIFIVFASSLLGFIVLNIPLNKTYILFSSFSGLFGASMLFFSIKNKVKVPQQTFYIEKIRNLKKGVFASFLFSFISGLLPAFTSSQATLISQTIFKIKGEREFLFLNGALTTGYAIFSLFALFCLEKARSGAGIAILSLPLTLNYSLFLLLCFSIFVSSSISIVTTLLLAKYFVKKLSKIDYGFLSKIILVFLSSLSFYFLGIPGLLIFLTSSSLGILCQIYKVKRTLLMSILIIPTIFLLLGF